MIVAGVDVHVTEAVSFVSRGGSGGTHPLLLRIADGRVAHVKFQHNPQSTRSLVSDWIGTLIGRALGAPVPDPVLVHVPREQLVRIPYLTKYRWQPGLQFGTIYLPNARPLTREVLGNLSNLADLPLCALLESWLYNRDVKFAHLLQVPMDQKHRLVITDHGFIFPHGPQWSVRDLRDYRDDFPLAKPLTTLALEVPQPWDFASALSKIQSMPASAIADIVNAVPAEWSLAPHKQSALIHFLIYRQHELDRAARSLEKAWSVKRGRQALLPAAPTQSGPSGDPASVPQIADGSSSETAEPAFPAWPQAEAGPGEDGGPLLC